MAPRRLGEALRVDGLFYGTVEDFAFQNVGFMLRREVKLRLRLVFASTGETLWDDSGEGVTVLAAIKKREAERRMLLKLPVR